MFKSSRFIKVKYCKNVTNPIEWIPWFITVIRTALMHSPFSLAAVINQGQILEWRWSVVLIECKFSAHNYNVMHFYFVEMIKGKNCIGYLTAKRFINDDVRDEIWICDSGYLLFYNWMFIFVSATSAGRLCHILQSNPDFNKLQSLMWTFIQLIQSNDPKYKLQIITCHGQNWKQFHLSYL